MVSISFQYSIGLGLQFWITTSGTKRFRTKEPISKWQGLSAYLVRHLLTMKIYHIQATSAKYKNFHVDKQQHTFSSMEALVDHMSINSSIAFPLCKHYLITQGMQNHFQKHVVMQKIMKEDPRIQFVPCRSSQISKPSSVSICSS